MNKKKGSNFLHRIKFKYKLSILNENTLEEVWRIRLSWLNVFLVSFTVAILYFFLIAFLIIKTPLRSFLPGYSDNNILRQKVMLNAVSVDSVMEVVRVRGQYLDMLQAVTSGNIPIDSVMSIDSLVQTDHSKINLDPSDKEKDYCKSFEREEKYSTGALDNSVAKMNYLIHKPAVAEVVGLEAGSGKQIVLELKMQQNTSVSAILDGVVVYSGVDKKGFGNIHIIHNNGMISYYSCRVPSLKKAGDHVYAGENITVPCTGDNNTLFFELWENGVSINPETLIVF